MIQRWVDVITPKKQDTRTGSEIAADVIKKAGLTIKNPKQEIATERR